MMATHRQQLRARIARNRRRRRLRHRWAGISRLHPQHTRPAGIHYDLDGRPISLVAWACHLEDEQYRHVALTRMPNSNWAVSTIWHGVNIGEATPPLIYETAIRRDAPQWQPEQRYATLEQALLGHDDCVIALRAEMLALCKAEMRVTP